MGSVQRMILSFRTLEKVKLYKARDLVEMTIARQPDLLENCLGSFGYAEAVHCDKHLKFSFSNRYQNGCYQPVSLSDADEAKSLSRYASRPRRQSFPSIHSPLSSMTPASSIAAAHCQWRSTQCSIWIAGISLS